LQIGKNISDVSQQVFFSKIKLIILVEKKKKKNACPPLQMLSMVDMFSIIELIYRNNLLFEKPECGIFSC